jgi:uncharacterized protein (TIGR02001 family)
MDRCSALIAPGIRGYPRLAALCLIAALGASPPRASAAAESWGGSLAATSDYLVRGISRSKHGAVLQADLHVATDSGLLGGVFASNVQFDSGDRRDLALLKRQPGPTYRLQPFRAPAVPTDYD